MFADGTKNSHSDMDLETDIENLNHDLNYSTIILACNSSIYKRQNDSRNLRIVEYLYDGTIYPKSLKNLIQFKFYCNVCLSKRSRLDIIDGMISLSDHKFLIGSFPVSTLKEDIINNSFRNDK
ncbi:hypothetical protein BpHYR1_005103 [Brachionus plicatilis]|uniref:Uncharacterized protein n=1 Tax=Brachionus plicatilis TaxID=10195 RepID=A0A3M7R5A2_BRAPC|nr:hypothetical protein BpHYR1_005103 [Brachionus plicatilis]